MVKETGEGKRTKEKEDLMYKEEPEEKAAGTEISITSSTWIQQRSPTAACISSLPQHHCPQAQKTCWMLSEPKFAMNCWGMKFADSSFIALDVLCSPRDAWEAAFRCCPSFLTTVIMMMTKNNDDGNFQSDWDSLGSPRTVEAAYKSTIRSRPTLLKSGLTLFIRINRPGLGKPGLVWRPGLGKAGLVKVAFTSSKRHIYIAESCQSEKSTLNWDPLPKQGRQSGAPPVVHEFVEVWWEEKRNLCVCSYVYSIQIDVTAY